MLRLAAILILAASQTAIAERALARGGMSGGVSGVSGGKSHGGHFVAGQHFDHERFGHRLRRGPAFIAPYGWDWPYADYGPGTAYNTTVVAYPTAISPVPTAADNCRWNEETFTVPASAGGTRPIQVVTCR
jgi:hypothetical protein